MSRGVVVALSTLGLTGLVAGCAMVPAPDLGFHAAPVTIADHGKPTRLHVDRAGRSGPAIIMLHGLGGTSQGWHAIAPRLAARFRVHMPDMLGFGRSDKPLGADYGLPAQARRIRAYMRRAGIRRATLVGNSIGGTVALHLARLDPGLVDRLVLIATPIAVEELPAIKFAAAVPDLAQAFERTVPAPILVSIGNGAAFPQGARPPAFEISGQAAALGSPGGKEAVIATIKSMIATDSTRFRRAVRGIAKPALVITCDDDTIVPPDQSRELARSLPHAHLEILPDCNHAARVLRGKTIARWIAAFAGRPLRR